MAAQSDYEYHLRLRMVNLQLDWINTCGMQPLRMLAQTKTGEAIMKVYLTTKGE
jgi:hypothetical protein